MKLARTGVLAAAVLSIATMAFAQAKADFSGTWTPEAPAAGAPGGGGGGGGRGMAGPMTVKQTGDTLTIERTMGENKVTQTYKLDGTESENKMMGRGGGGEVVTKSTAKWDGSKLVISTKSTGPDGAERVQTQTWSLEGGNLTIERPGRDGAVTKTVYKKTT
jgi:hypothetical protein